MRCGVSFHLVPFLYDKIHPFPCETFQCILIAALMSRSSVPLAVKKKKKIALTLEAWPSGGRYSSATVITL